MDTAGNIMLSAGGVRDGGLTTRQLVVAIKTLLVRSNQPGMTVLTTVAVAGGFTWRAAQDVFSVVRTTSGKSSEGRADRGTRVEPGDAITVYQRML